MLTCEYRMIPDLYQESVSTLLKVYEYVQVMSILMYKCALCMGVNGCLVIKDITFSYFYSDISITVICFYISNSFWGGSYIIDDYFM